VVPAILSALLSGIWVSRWKASFDHAEKRIDDLCTEIAKLGDLASEYWITPQSDPKIPVLQARVSTGLIRISAMRVTLSQFVSGLASDRLLQLEQLLIRQATGGDFGVHNRTTSVVAAAGAQHAASNYVVEIRRARLASFSRRWLPRV
jgi:hypothetical protein